MQVKLKVNAKINLSLRVVGVKDGYHMLDSEVASVSIADVICARKSEGVTVSFLYPLGYGKKTNALLAAEYMADRFGLCGVDIYIENNIPSGAGLGGSSADCAGVILAINKLFGLGLTLFQMSEIALMFGSDTAYMLTGGFARMTGRGETVDRKAHGECRSVSIAYKGSVDTGKCFKLFDQIGSGVGSVNDLTKAASVLNPCVKECLDIVGAGAFMTGSGSAVVCDRLDGDKRALLLGSGYNVIDCDVVNGGIEWL